MKLSHRQWGAGGHPFLDLILASRELLTLPVGRCLLFIFCPELPLSQAPCLALWLRPHFPPPQQPLELLFSKEWLGWGGTFKPFP